MNPRLIKQIVIGLVFLLIVGSIIYFGFFREGGEETALETPAAISPPEIISEHLFKVDDFDYDFLAVIRNPNTEFGAAQAVYKLQLFDSSGELIFSKDGTTYISPGQIRYEVISPIKLDKEVADAEFKIENVAWQGVKEFLPQSIFLVRNQEYVPVNPPEEGFAEVRGTLLNNSNFDFDAVDVFVVLYDQDGRPLAVNRTDIRTFLSKTDRFFEVKWIRPFEGEVSRLDIQAYTNLFFNQNFIKEYGTQEEFQKFY